MSNIPSPYALPNILVIMSDASSHAGTHVVPIVFDIDGVLEYLKRKVTNLDHLICVR